MLRMCESHQHNFKSLRECEQWARKKRDMRITVLLALEKNTKGWTPYYKKKSIHGVLSTMQEKYPVVAALTTESVRKTDYESCVGFKESMENLSITIKKHQEMVDNAVADTLLPSRSVKSGKSEVYDFYQPLKKTILEVASQINAQYAHVEKLVETCEGR
ncbi:Hypothetical predicted protein, partial [Paramuricea clavata]